MFKESFYRNEKIVANLFYTSMIFGIKRRTQYETRYSPQMGVLYTRVTFIKKYFLKILPIRTIHHYRETYYGEIKDCDDCVLSA